MLGHVARVGSAHVVPAVGIGRVAAVVPPAAAVLPGALLGGIPGGPGAGEQGQRTAVRPKGKLIVQSATSYGYRRLAC